MNNRGKSNIFRLEELSVPPFMTDLKIIADDCCSLCCDPFKADALIEVYEFDLREGLLQEPV